MRRIFDYIYFMYYNKLSISQLYDKFYEDIRLKILGEKDSYIIGNSIEELTTYYYQSKNLDLLEIDNEKGESAEIKKQVRTVPASQRDHFYQSDGDLKYEFESIHVTIALKYNPNFQNILAVRPSTISLSWSPDDLKWNAYGVDFSLDIKGYGFSKSQDQIASEINWQKQQIYNFLHLVNTEIEKCSITLQSRIRSFVSERKIKLEQDQDKYASLLTQINIPLKKREDEATKRIQIDHKPLVSSVRPTAKQPENFYIDRQKVLDIISVIDNQGMQFEKTPQSFQQSGEEDLRNVILVGLNALFEGKATGETFNNKGKSDIYLNIEKGSILVCECKIWAGQNLYGKTIDQLLSYLTWRENFGIMITFVRNKSFSKVLSEPEQVIISHKTFLNGFKKLSNTHFLSNHHLPGDDLKKVEVHHLFYHVQG